MAMPRSEEKPVFQELAEVFEGLPLRAGVLTAATLALIGWTLPLFFPSTGLNLDGSLAVAGRYLIWGLAFMILVSASFGAARRWIDGRRFDSGVRLADLGW